MAEELAGYCGPRCELIVVPNLAHNQPFYRPTMDYWGLIADWLSLGHGSLSSEHSPRSLP